MFCPKCGNDVKNGAQFCPKCGEKMRVNTGSTKKAEKKGVSFTWKRRLKPKQYMGGNEKALRKGRR